MTTFQRLGISLKKIVRLSLPILIQDLVGDKLQESERNSYKHLQVFELVYMLFKNMESTDFAKMMNEFSSAQQLLVVEIGEIMIEEAKLREESFEIGQEDSTQETQTQ